MAVSRTTIAFTIVPGKKVTLDAPADLRLGQAALNDVLVDQKRSCLKLTYLSALNAHIHDSEDEEDEHDGDDDDEDGGDKEYTVNLANLIPGVIETQTLGGLIINSGERVIFEATGKNTIHISGNVILQDTFDEPPSDDEFDEEDEEEEEGDIDDEELAGMDDEDKEAFLKALSRSGEMELDDEEPAPKSKKSKPTEAAPASVPVVAVEKTETKDKTLSKKEKKAAKAAAAAAAAAATGNPAAAAVATTSTTTTTTTTSTATTTAAAVKSTGAGTGAENKESKKRKEVESPAKDKDAKPKDKDESVPAAKKAKGQDGKPVPAGEKKEKEKEKGKKPVEVRTTPSGLKIADKTLGDGPGAKPRQTLSMRYILKLANGKIVDKNTNGKPFKFTLGAGEVIKGWDEGLVGMKVGGERTLEVPPQLGYGKRKSADIPANSTLFFEVKLLDIGK